MGADSQEGGRQWNLKLCPSRWPEQAWRSSRTSDCGSPSRSPLSAKPSPLTGLAPRYYTVPVERSRARQPAGSGLPGAITAYRMPPTERGPNFHREKSSHSGEPRFLRQSPVAAGGGKHLGRKYGCDSVGPVVGRRSPGTAAVIPPPAAERAARSRGKDPQFRSRRCRSVSGTSAGRFSAARCFVLPVSLLEERRREQGGA
jgi:hypothetical protein